VSDLGNDLVKVAVTYPVNVNGASSHTIVNVGAGKRFIVFACCLVAGAAATVEVKSGATAITGEIDLTTAPIQFGVGGGVPLWTGRALGDDLVFTTIGAVDFDGWVLVAEVDQ